MQAGVSMLGFTTRHTEIKIQYDDQVLKKFPFSEITYEKSRLLSSSDVIQGADSELKQVGSSRNKASR
jgi:hypothetical protein